ncbi:hypothetical protein [Streptomyces sp. NPDC047123]|uniref:hypothetical protein n=1 Tax=Streptomyces sp. NPDC047123 TaxID=3155622 RepID=UPI00340601A2
MSTDPAAHGTSSPGPRPRTALPEPALRPRAQRGPGVELSHRARLFVEERAHGRELVLRNRRGTRRLPVGGVPGSGGVSRAVFVDAGGADAERMGPPVPGSWGELQLQDAEGALLGRVVLDDWLPEADALPKRSVHGDQLLSRTGAAGLLTAAHVPLHTVRDGSDPLVAPRPGGRAGATLSPGSPFPLWYWVVRGLAALVWFATFTVLVFTGTARPWLVLVSAGAALAAPVARLALRGWTRLRLGRLAPVAVTARIAPRPAPGTGATVRFCRSTELRVQEHDLVLKDFSGQEHWLPRRGPHAVTALMLVRDRSGRPLGVELRGPDQQIRAVLPWELWFGADDGGWATLRNTTGLTAGERRLTGRGSWPKGPALGLRVLPSSGKEARAMSRFPVTLVGVSSTAVMALGSFFSLVQGTRLLDTHATAAWSAMAMGAIGGALHLFPYAIHQLRGRFVLDRPAREQVTPS